MKQPPPSSVVSRVWLGTVQLGMRYGLAERQPTREEAFRLLDAAWDAGVRKLDTARVYGEAEAVIGAWIRRTRRKPTVASKLPDLSAVADEDVAGAFDTALAETLRLLGLDHIDAYLCHHAADFHRPSVRSCFRRAITDGRIGRTGVSGYSPEEGLSALAADPGLGMVQLPANLADRRVQDSTLPGRFDAQHRVLVLRSVFLQGMLLAAPADLPDHLSPLKGLVTRLRQVGQDHGVALEHLAAGHVLHAIPSGDIAVGFNEPAQLHSLATLSLSGTPFVDALETLAADLPSLPTDTIDPRKWPRQA